MDDLIVAERQHEVLAKGVPNAEGDVVLVELAEPRIHAEVVQHVVHPTHIPFKVEAQTTNISGPRDHWPRGRFFRDRKRAGEVAKDQVVDLPQEVRRFNVSRPPYSLESTRLPCGCSQGRASKQPHPPEYRRCDTCQTKTKHSPLGSCEPRGDHS